MPTTFLSHPWITTSDPKDINHNFDETEDAKDIDNKVWEGQEDNNNVKITQDSNDYV